MTGNLRMDTVRPFRWTSFENMKRAQEVTAISTRAIQETRELATHDSVLTSVAGNLAYRCSGWFEITIPDMAVELPVVYWQSIQLLIGRSLVQAQPQEPDKNPELRFRVFVTHPPKLLYQGIIHKGYRSRRSPRRTTPCSSPWTTATGTSPCTVPPRWTAHCSTRIPTNSTRTT